jgi:hypothetical protein
LCLPQRRLRCWDCQSLPVSKRSSWEGALIRRPEQESSKANGTRRGSWFAYLPEESTTYVDKCLLEANGSAARDPERHLGVAAARRG